mgnify:CR=1 FL=1
MERTLEAKPVEALPKSACLFLHKGVDTSTERRIVGSIPNKGIIGPYSTLVFETEPLDLSYIDLKRSYFSAKVRAERLDKGSLQATDFTPTNNLFHR